MYPVEKDYMLASDDQVAIDAVAAKMMGFNPMDIGYIRLADENGLGNGRPENIEITGEDISKVNFNFSVGDNFASTVGDVMWFGALKEFQNFFFRTPLVNVFIMSSEVYHDYFRWPFVDSVRFVEWLRTSKWGGLFKKYPKN